MKHLPLVLFAIIILSCGFVPEKTDKPVSDTDVIGTWEFRTTAPDVVVTYTFRPDHTLRQVVSGTSIKRTQDGTWQLDGASLQLKDVLTEFNGWTVNPMGWWFIDDGNGGVLPFGGISPDPDNWGPLKRIE